MMIVRLCGGLGNQLFQYAVGKQLSVKNNIPLKIDDSWLRLPDARKYRLQFFQIEEPLASPQEVERFVGPYESQSLYARLYRKVQNMLPRHRRRYFQESGFWAYEPELMRIRSQVFLEGFWQHHAYFTRLHPQVLEALQLREEYRQEPYAVLDQIREDAASVSLHIRRGDYVSDPYNLQFFGVMPLSYYQQAVAYMQEQLHAPTFYIFSDDLDWARAHLKLQAPMVFVDIEGGRKEYLELEAMRLCRHNILANSSFSWWGAYLNTNPHKRVIAPRQWVADPELKDKVQIQMPDWILL
ncbi:alpha-1,2-fucosyltransferase [Cesiribacter andamanensis]|uniref:Glycosyl transferase family 11 n=1 Tax=Cesiribacter andamanensis AMV16 TaxID=1279009 RepID=M7NQT7_9BACT|nr:alpha-1,2-fucosyltransferase [Cesiribacter andamanensis]EMR00859.1 Glycosyl transferase family 11 [Cesiribacter andamanensis AMV16]